MACHAALRELALAGSTNIDERSLFLNDGMMGAFFDLTDVQRFAHWIDRQRMDAMPCRSQPPGMVHGLAEGTIRFLAFRLWVILPTCRPTGRFPEPRNRLHLVHCTISVPAPNGRNA